MSIDFATAVQAEYIAHHLRAMRDSKMPAIMFHSEAYELLYYDGQGRGKQILEAYELDIQRTMKKGVFQKEKFVYRKLPGDSQ